MYPFFSALLIQMQKMPFQIYLQPTHKQDEDNQSP